MSKDGEHLIINSNSKIDSKLWTINLNLNLNSNQNKNNNNNNKYQMK